MCLFVCLHGCKGRICFTSNVGACYMITFICGSACHRCKCFCSGSGCVPGRNVNISLLHSQGLNKEPRTMLVFINAPTCILHSTCYSVLVHYSSDAEHGCLSLVMASFIEEVRSYESINYRKEKVWEIASVVAYLYYML